MEIRRAVAVVSMAASQQSGLRTGTTEKRDEEVEVEVEGGEKAEMDAAMEIRSV